ncbi:35.1 kDa [Spodoptera frugiperda ascovirus 1a]|uniref:35.1 kDa n=1 Tax=Spodoptera frugiperda ascovirus 1a TaxID=113370 RepID=Q0E546_SFAVA|nr:35.1 kDa [Spodoptera frugiperda ascovirus 1a]CAL44655.1 35.1 kDa [Spodoptera frugiperda ascovirus 1a]
MMIDTYDENVLATPYVMAVREYALGVRKNVGLFVPKKCISSCKWRRVCPPVCNDAKCSHYKNLACDSIATKTGDEIDGYIVTNPKFLILSASGPLKIVDGVNKGSVTDVEFKLYKNDKTGFTIVNKYKLLFLDEKNMPLHDVALQFTCKGTCAMTFLRQLKAWNACIDRFCFRNNRRAERDNKYLWTFEPVLEQRMMGKAGTSAAACCFVGFEFDKDATKVYEKHYTGIISETMNIANDNETKVENGAKPWIAGDSLFDNVLDVFNYSDEDEEDDNETPRSGDAIKRRAADDSPDNGPDRKTSKSGTVVVDF